MAGVFTVLGKQQRPLVSVPPDWSLRGLFLSDSPDFFAFFSRKWDVSNVFYHKYPVLDLFSVPDAAKKSFNFVVCSDVLEHVGGSPLAALEGLRALLKPGGAAVVTVPIGDPVETVEHYPGMVDYKVLDGPAVQWRDESGTVTVDNNPEMHGGDGLVVAFRRFGKSEFENQVVAAGFTCIQEIGSLPSLGIWALPEGQKSGVFLLSNP